MSALRICLLAGLCLIAVLVAQEIVKRKKLAVLVPPAQYRFRLLAAVLLSLEIVMIFLGTIFVVRMGPLPQVLYWSGCLLVALLMLVAAIIDVRGVLINYIIERHKIMKDNNLRSSDE